MKLQQHDSNNQPQTTARSWWHQSLCYLLILALTTPSLPSYCSATITFAADDN